jgi:hypothetical protein
MNMKKYFVVCEWKEGLLTEYVFWAKSWHDCKLQASGHGLFGDKPIRVEQRFKHFIESFSWENS